MLCLIQAAGPRTLRNPLAESLNAVDGGATSRARATGWPELGDTRPMKLYFAGPLFTTPERIWNAEVVAALRAAGHEIFLPQEKEPGMDAAGIFAMDVGAIDWADGLVAIMDGPDPDAGTSWEVGYAYGSRKPIVLVRTDFRELAGEAGRYNPLLAESATIRLYLPMASTTEVITAIREALSMIERDRLGKGATPA
jgi:nucleoside 2-deoxyribosyltransferase